MVEAEIGLGQTSGQISSMSYERPGRANLSPLMFDLQGDRRPFTVAPPMGSTARPESDSCSRHCQPVAVKNSAREAF